tara:strand:+ start:616 stop:1074 length:459 start_codon:yes stop_codon:yes gene_type:complete
MEMSLKNQWVRNVISGAASLAMAALPLTGNPAIANDAQDASHHPVFEYIENTDHTRKEAFLDSTGKIIIHYGDNIEGVPATILALRNLGYPTFAYAGAEDRTVELFIDRGKFGLYSQDDLNSGLVGGYASRFYNDRVGEPTSGPLASLSPEN